jgi:hypothetical protein
LNQSRGVLRQAVRAKQKQNGDREPFREHGSLVDARHEPALAAS